MGRVFEEHGLFGGSSRNWRRLPTVGVAQVARASVSTPTEGCVVRCPPPTLCKGSSGLVRAREMAARSEVQILPFAFADVVNRHHGRLKASTREGSIPFICVQGSSSMVERRRACSSEVGGSIPPCPNPGSPKDHFKLTSHERYAVVVGTRRWRKCKGHARNPCSGWTC